MIRARYWHELIALADGTALAIGGIDVNGNPLNTCERYNPTTHTWATTGSMAFVRHHHAAICLPDGRVLVIGGTGGVATQGGSEPLSTCEIYDPTTSLWSSVSPMAVARTTPVAAYIPSRNVVTVTGSGSTVIENLDLATMRWSRARAVLGAGLTDSAGTLLEDDILVVVGGLQNANNTVADDYLLIPGVDALWVGGINGETVVASVPTSTSFTYTNPMSRSGYVTAAAGAVVTPSKAPSAPVGVPGPFSYDTKEGLSVTSVVANLGAPINAKQSYSTLPLSTLVTAEPALEFPDQVGYLALDFGFKGQVGPIKYLGRFDSTALLIDASFKFPLSIPAGVTVTLLQSNAPFVPPTNINPLPGNFYATGSSAGRVAAQAALDDIQAAGIDIVTTIQYPGDRGLGNEGRPDTGTDKLSDVVQVWGGDDLDNEVAADREES